GWTVVPRDHFGGYRAVSATAVDGRGFAVGRGGSAFVLQDRAPAPPQNGGRGAYGLGAAVPRGAGRAASTSATAPGAPARRNPAAGLPASSSVASAVPA